MQKIPRNSDRLVRLYPSPGHQLERTKFRKSQNIGHCAENNKSHLESLELDLIDWPHMRKELGYQNDSEVVHGLKSRDYINETVFGLDKRSPCIKFPNLHTLVLSHVPLSVALAETVDFEILKSLTMRSCPLWYEFVLTMAERRIPVRLKKLELQESWPTDDAETDDFEDGDPTEVLLEYFRELEEFYLDQTDDMLSKDT